MKLPIRLHSEEVITVELEYEKLEKHCFVCFILNHEKKDCPLRLARGQDITHHDGINQQRTLDRLESDKRRQDSRREIRGSSSRFDSHRNQRAEYPQIRRQSPLSRLGLNRDGRYDYSRQIGYGRDWSNHLNKSHHTASKQSSVAPRTHQDILAPPRRRFREDSPLHSRNSKAYEEDYRSSRSAGHRTSPYPSPVQEIARNPVQGQRVRTPDPIT
ncbi:unnamed protein product [Arabis nemorensis]|uniref:Zinc knuckle CX2CX4HX4C domain-containing protein n=1 Tax=Arabis nemorensis TaxID=586526 RepID=A0A565BHD1_9BRAS|nr:unnamed protein product [Arabis nemorensis]